tara:strand:+ start:3150 stop:3533 length:384 start_codon:yes stop_codon:yes gene_type:complete
MFDRAYYANKSRIPGEAAMELDLYRQEKSFDFDATDRFADLIKKCLPYVSVVDAHFNFPLYRTWLRVFEQIGDPVEDINDPADLVIKLKVVRADLEFPNGMDGRGVDKMISLCVECSEQFMAMSTSD